MRASLGLTLSFVLGTLVQPALAEDPAIDISTNAKFELVALTDQTLTESATLTVQPRDAGSPEDALSEDWPSHCLLSVNVTLTEGGAALNPGKLICITEDHRILEAMLDAAIEEFGACVAVEGNDCARYRVESGETGRLVLNAPAKLTLQPRNELN